MKYSCDVKINRDNSFEMEKWNNVPTQYWPIYSWVWGTPLTKEGIENKLREMRENDIRAVYVLPLPKNFRPMTMVTDLEPDYLSDEYLELFAYASECAAKLGMHMYIYDEGGWPSGSACGKVVEKCPHLIRKKVEKVEKTSPYIPSENAVAAFSKGKRIMPGEESEEPITEYVSMPSVGVTAPPGPDLTMEGTTECFIELTHEAYKKHLGKDVFGKSVTMFFTDEPGVTAFPWNDKFIEEFKARYGYDMIDYLPAVADKKYETEEEKKFACDYYDLLGERFARNYFLKLRKWCRENNLYSSGHLNGEDSTINCIKTNFVHALRQLRCFDVPGVDAIWRQIFPGQKNHFFPRLAASAASQIGSSMAITESFGVYGAGITFDQMRYVTTYQMVRGINIMNPLNCAYSLGGHFMTGERPYFNTVMPAWKHLGEYNRYVAKLSYLMNLGKAETDYAIYMPMRDMWAHGEEAQKAADAFDCLAYYLEEKHCQFEIIDDDFLETATVKNGIITTGDAEYKIIIIPECNRMPEYSKNVLSDFEKTGGEVIYSNTPENIIPTAIIKGSKTTVLKKTIYDGKIYLIVNENDKEDLISAEFTEKGKIYFLNAEKGGIYLIENIKDMAFASGEGRVFLVTDKEYNAPIYWEDKKEIMTLTDFESKRVFDFVIEEEGIRKTVYNEDYSPIDLGNWQEKYGADFSGLVSYRTKFNLDEITSVTLDLGKVSYSCEVIVNGESIGICIANPFKIKIDKKYLRKENQLEIVVANTEANQYASTKVFDSWSERDIGPYHKVALEFEKEMTEGGLSGPVKILG